MTGRVEIRDLPLCRGTLMESVGTMMEALGAETAMMTLDGLEIGPFDYVMPDRSRDGIHAAWYSETHHTERARIEHGTATIGRRGDAWWLHAHAVWDGTDGRACGHLLPDRVTQGGATLPVASFTGGGFVVTEDAETAFSLFRPVAGEARPRPNALIASLAPHEDLVTSVREMAARHGLTRVMGIGSLIGAHFVDAPAMSSPISEVLLLPSAETGAPLPVHCVDPEGNQFRERLDIGGGAVCVTFELLLWRP